uniref:Uncharacterized protein n=1 Tax=Glossina brevipalpis TaxID=37001 RepID=A0A1A9WXU3_9MUSC
MRGNKNQQNYNSLNLNIIFNFPKNIKFRIRLMSYSLTQLESRRRHAPLWCRFSGIAAVCVLFFQSFRLPKNVYTHLHLNEQPKGRRIKVIFTLTDMLRFVAIEAKENSHNNLMQSVGVFNVNGTFPI